MKRRKPRITYMNCPRCGKKVTTLVDPIHSSRQTQKIYQGICSDCIRPDEEKNMLNEMADNLRGKI